MKNIMKHTGVIMACTFAFGTGFAARTSGLPILAAVSALLLGASASASEAPVAVAPTVAASIDLAITGLRSEKGNVLVCLSADPEYFPVRHADVRSAGDGPQNPLRAGSGRKVRTNHGPARACPNAIDVRRAGASGHPGRRVSPETQKGDWG